MRDPAKAKAKKRRYLDRKKALKYGEQSIGVDMRGKHGNHAKGSANHRWNGGRWKHPDGYVGIAVPVGHHLRQAHGYAFEHQLVAEQKLGRRLLPGEVVHHINGVRDDNRPENLEVTTVQSHAKEHVSIPTARDCLGRFTKGKRVQEFPA